MIKDSHCKDRQISDAAGILFGFLSWTVVEHSTESLEARWRILNLTALIPTIPLLVAAYLVPESYIFSMKTRKYRKAAEAACLYRRSRLQGLRNLIASHFQMETEGQLMQMRNKEKRAEHQARSRDEENVDSAETVKSDHHNNGTTIDETKPLPERLIGPVPGTCLVSDRIKEDGDARASTQSRECPHRYHMKEIHFFQRLWQIFKDARCRRALLSSGMAMGAQSLCGINAFAFFSSSLINAEIPSSVSLALAIAFGGVNFGFGLLTPLLSDRRRLGRTTLLLLGLSSMSVLMFILASVFELHNSARTPTVVLVSSS